MRIIKSKTFLVVCIFALAISFISVAFAAKPVNPPQRTKSVKYGYAILEVGNMITGDGKGQYIDIENVTYGDPSYLENGLIRGDKIRVYSYDDGAQELIWLRAFIGKPELLEGSTGYRSPRRVNFNFDLYRDVKNDVEGNPIRPGEGMAVYDILSTPDSSSPRGNEQSDGKYYLTDGTVHFVVAIGSCDFFGEEAQNRAMFMIDQGCLAEPPAISQTSVDAFYDNDNDPAYWTSIQGAETTAGDSEAHDQIAYHLLVNQLAVTEGEDTNNDGKKDTWVITPNQGTTTLQVYKNIGRKNPKYVPVSLATYTNITFKVTLSLIPFPHEQKAPGRYPTTLSTVWGGIKKADR